MFYWFLTGRVVAPGTLTQLFVVFYVDIFSHLNGNKSWELYKQVRAVLKTYSQPLYSMFCKYFSEFQNISKLYFSLVQKWYIWCLFTSAISSCFSNKIFLHQTLILIQHSYIYKLVVVAILILYTSNPFVRPTDSQLC